MNKMEVDVLRNKLRSLPGCPAFVPVLTKPQLVKMLVASQLETERNDENEAKAKWSSTVSGVLDSHRADSEDAEMVEVQCEGKMLITTKGNPFTEVDKTMWSIQSICVALKQSLMGFVRRHPDSCLDKVYYEKGKAGKQKPFVIPSAEQSLDNFDGIKMLFFGDVRFSMSPIGQNLKEQRIPLGDQWIQGVRVFFFVSPSIGLPGVGRSRCRAWDVSRAKSEQPKSAKQKGVNRKPHAVDEAPEEKEKRQVTNMKFVKEEFEITLDESMGIECDQAEGDQLVKSTCQSESCQPTDDQPNEAQHAGVKLEADQPAEPQPEVDQPKDQPAGDGAALDVDAVPVEKPEGDQMGKGEESKSQNHVQQSDQQIVPKKKLKFHRTFVACIGNECKLPPNKDKNKSQEPSASQAAPAPLHRFVELVRPSTALELQLQAETDGKKKRKKQGFGSVDPLNVQAEVDEDERAELEALMEDENRAEMLSIKHLLR